MLSIRTKIDEACQWSGEGLWEAAVMMEISVFFSILCRMLELNLECNLIGCFDCCVSGWVWRGVGGDG